MFERPRKKIVDNAHVHGLTKTVLPNQLVLKNKRPEQIASIAKTSQLAPKQFKQLCDSLLYNLLNYTQQLPDTTNSYFSSPGGAFEHALSRTKAATELFQLFLLEDPNTVLSKTQQRWWYALFSAGLLRGIGKLPLDYKIQLYNAHGHLIKPWQPLLEPLGSTAHAYTFDTINSNYDDTFRQRLNIVLAQHLMPKEGFTWLTEDLDVFEVWLALLHEDSASSRTLGLILDRADDIAIQEDLINLPPNIDRDPAKSRGKPTSFIDSPQDDLVEREQFVGSEFIKWMLINLEAATLTFNQHPLYNVAGGTIISPDTFKLFVRESPMFKNWLSVKRSVELLCIHDTSPGATDDGSLMLKGSIGLPGSFQHQASKNAGFTETNAIDARNPGARRHLTANGQWKAVNKNTASLAPKNTPYG
ncbi:MAG: TraI domain-containing protein [Gammaproteobacteria bacterium]|nr:TraI domain-containing protein [Gammaproteobacteria bacterium]MCH9716813.1 TraI domain-containing protein [Gammaproteobacteria bacterium]MCH9763145.1 TraI domain-containing protein [Gammaproteobacteria bacterium]